MNSWSSIHSPELERHSECSKKSASWSSGSTTDGIDGTDDESSTSLDTCSNASSESCSPNSGNNLIASSQEQKSNIEGSCTLGRQTSTSSSPVRSLSFGPLREELIELLEQRGVASELLETWFQKEAKLFRRCRKLKSGVEAQLEYAEQCDTEPEKNTIQTHEEFEDPLSMAGREAILRFLRHLCELYQAQQQQQSVWFDVVLLFDVFRIEACLPLDDLPTACAAVVSVVRKQESQQAPCIAMSLAREASALAGWLSKIGISAGGEVTIEDINKMELRLLERFKWRVNLPSVHTWMRTFCERLNLILRGKFNASLAWVFQQSLQSAWAYLQSNPACGGNMTPSRIANGLFCLTLISARLVPLHALKVPQMPADAWSACFMGAQWQGGEMPSCSLPQGHLEAFLDAIQVATGSNAEHLRTDTYAVAVAMGTIVAKPLAGAVQTSV